MEKYIYMRVCMYVYTYRQREKKKSSAEVPSCKASWKGRGKEMIGKTMGNTLRKEKVKSKRRYTYVWSCISICTERERERLPITTNAHRVGMHYKTPVLLDLGTPLPSTS